LGCQGLSREHYATTLLALLGVSALLGFITARYGLTASVHKPLAPLSYTAFSLLFLWTILLSTASFHRPGRADGPQIGLILTGAGCAATSAILYSFGVDPGSVWRFPSTGLGALVFRLLSLPVSILHTALALLGVEIPIYLGLLISVPTLLLSWALLLTTISRRLGGEGSGQGRGRVRPSLILRHRPADRTLLAVSLAVAVLVRAVPLIIGYMPTGFDTPYYIGTLQGSPKLRWPETAWHRDTPVAYLLLTAIGAVLRITRPIPQSEVRFVELLPVVLHAMVAAGAYSLTKKATGSSRSAVLGSLLASSAPSQLRMSFDLYKNILGISILAFSLGSYLSLIRERRASFFFITLILLCILLGIHPYPALILILTLLTYTLGSYLLSADRGGGGRVLLITLTLFLAAAIILAPLTHRFLRESPLIDEPWPHEPTTPIFRMPVLTQRGGEFLLLTAGTAGLIYCLLKGRRGEVLLSVWLLVTFVLAEQTPFQVFFEAGESEKVPRFIWHLAYPNSILGAVGIVQAVKLLGGSIPARAPDRRVLRLVFATAVLSLLLSLHTSGAVIYMADYGPMMERSNYTAMIWLDLHSTESSGLTSLYPHHLKQYLWQTHLKAPWEGVAVRDLFCLRIYGSGEYDLDADLDRILDAGGSQLYHRSGLFTSF